jgi:hypothetical protein
MKDELNVPVLATCGILGVLLLVVVVFGVQAYFLNYQNEEEARKADNTVNHFLVDLRSEQHKNISTYHWVDKDKKIAAIPIEDAMKAVVQANGKVSTALAQ